MNPNDALASFAQDAAAPPSPPLQPPPSQQPPVQPPGPVIYQLSADVFQQLLAALPNHQQPPHTGLPRGVKAPTIDSFDGKKTTEVRNWLTRTRNILLLSGFELDTMEAVRYAASHLTGTAHSWFQSECQRAPYGLETSGGFGTFNDFADALAAHLGDPHPATKARRRLRELKQVTSVKSFADEFQRIIVDLPDRHQADLQFDFINGLKPRIKELLVGKVPEDMAWQDVRDLAYLFDDAVMEHRYRASSYNSPNNRSRSDNRKDDPMDISTLLTQLASLRTSAPSPHPHHRSSNPGHSRPHTSGTAGNSYPAKLTDAERTRLRASGSCFRCRQPGHHVSDCPLNKAASKSRFASPATTTKN